MVFQKKNAPIEDKQKVKEQIDEPKGEEREKSQQPQLNIDEILDAIEGNISRAYLLLKSLRE